MQKESKDSEGTLLKTQTKPTNKTKFRSFQCRRHRAEGKLLLNGLLWQWEETAVVGPGWVTLQEVGPSWDSPLRGRPDKTQLWVK